MPCFERSSFSSDNDGDPFAAALICVGLTIAIA